MGRKLLGSVGLTPGSDSGFDLDTKGQIHGYSSTQFALDVGTANQSLLVDSSATAGIKWGASSTSTLTTTGDLLAASAANTLTRIAPTTSGHVLTANGAGVLPTFQAVASGGGWSHLTTETLEADGTLVASWTELKNYLHIVSFAARASSDTQGWQFNDDTGNSYDNNRSYNFGASTVRDDKPCISPDGINTDDYFHATFMDFINLEAYNKYGYASDQRQSTGTDGSMDTQQTSLCWQNTDEQIIKITGVDHEGNAIDYKENSFIIVFGRD